MNVSAALKSGFLYSSLYFLTMLKFFLDGRHGLAPEAVSSSEPNERRMCVPGNQAGSCNRSLPKVTT